IGGVHHAQPGRAQPGPSGGRRLHAGRTPVQGWTSLLRVSSVPSCCSGLAPAPGTASALRAEPCAVEQIGCSGLAPAPGTARDQSMTAQRGLLELQWPRPGAGHCKFLTVGGWRPLNELSGCSGLAPAPGTASPVIGAPRTDGPSCSGLAPAP